MIKSKLKLLRVVILGGLTCFYFSDVRGADLPLGDALPLADKGDAEAQFIVGKAYATGHGFNLDYAKALEYYLKSAQQGNYKAQNNLGYLYLEGKGTAKNQDEALKWLRKSASSGAAQSQTNLGLLLLRGESLKANPKEAVSWLEKATAQNYTDAELLLGETYFFGRFDVEKNIKAAMPLLRNAAKKGKIHANHLLGVAAAYGFGVKQSFEDAAAIYQKNAEQGYALSQSNLGQLYAAGKGVPQDYVTAYKWLYLGAIKGEITAVKYLHDFELKLTPVQISEGKRQAEEFQKQLTKNQASQT
jgi:TPR repeat protein